MIGLILFVLYFGYNVLQVNRQMSGKRFDRPFVLFLFAAPIDLIALLKK